MTSPGFFKTLLAPQDQKATGLEALASTELVNKVQARAFPQAKTLRSSEISWSQVLEKGDLSEDPALQAVNALLRGVLADSSLIELGVGIRSEKHYEIFKSRYHISRYMGVDAYPFEPGPYFTHQDLLLFLEIQPDSSANVCAFGVFNEPLGPIHSPLFWLPCRPGPSPNPGNLEHEYLRRLARQLFRVTGPQGVLFGDGIRPLRRRLRNWPSLGRWFQIFPRYLEAAGFQAVYDLEPQIDAFNLSKNREVFLYRKP
ncbi:MAG: hypothetical protein K1X83_04055 [Oligoflexia bacterium]|nr:hypothetical protein [Oligoflexia bacterium]